MKDLIKTLFSILKYAGKAVSIFRNFVINAIFLLLLIVILLSLFSREEKSIPNDTALLLSLNGDIVEEKRADDPFNEFVNESMGFSRLPEETLLQDVLDAVNQAATDNRINSIVLDLRRLGSISFNQIDDIGNALESFKLTGKRIVAAEDIYTQRSYLLASYANKVFLNPVGLVDMRGLGAYRLYFKEGLEKLKINYHVFKVGDYKSALEPFTRNSMSEEAKAQNSLWLEAQWDHYKTSIQKRRNVDAAVIDTYTNNITELLAQSDGDTAQLAAEIQLVDELKTREELRSYLVGMTGESESRGFRYVTLKEYMHEIPRSYQPGTSSKNTVGIIIAQGNILTGEQPPGAIGSESLMKLIRKARLDDTVKAVVLRVISGGGSVFASEIIREELHELRESGKPLVISMGSVAASGGYWIAAEADQIWAHPTTLTGSIGIFGAIPTFENSLGSLGIYSDGIGTTSLASGMNLTQPLLPEIRQAIQLNIEHGYEEFLSIVSEGRDLHDEALNRVVQGRVFDGLTAQELGLVDKIGDLADAIESAANLAGVEQLDGVYIKSESSFSEKILQQLQNALFSYSSIWSLVPKEFHGYFTTLRESASPLIQFDDPRGMYAHWLINYL